MKIYKFKYTVYIYHFCGEDVIEIYNCLKNIFFINCSSLITEKNIRMKRVRISVKEKS